MDGYDTAGGEDDSEESCSTDLVRREGGPWRQEFPDLQCAGLFFTPKKVDNLCGWMALTAFLLDQAGPNVIRGPWTAEEKAEIPLIVHERCPTWPKSGKSLTLLVKTARKKQKSLAPALTKWKRFGDLLRQHIAGPESDNLFVVERDANKFVANYPDYCVHIFTSRHPQPYWTSKGSNYSLTNIRHDPKTIFLYYDRIKEHFHYIRYPNRFFGGVAKDEKQLCYGCFQRFLRKPGRYDSETRSSHTCVITKCEMCDLVLENAAQLEKHCKSRSVACSNCFRKFHGQECLGRHQRTCSDYTDNSLAFCEVCRKMMIPKIGQNGYVPRKCRDCRLCKICQRPREKNHKCFWVTRRIPKLKTPEEACANYWVFDFESMFVPGPDVVRNTAKGRVTIATKEHVVNYVVVRRLFTEEEHTFQDMPQFVNFLRFIAGGKNSSTFIAHNMKGYDGRLLFT